MSCVDKLCLDTKCGPSRLNTIYQHNSWDHNSRLNTTYLNTIYLNTIYLNAIYQHISARREVWSFVCAKVCAVLCGVMRCYAVLCCHVTYSHVWHDAFICVTWRIHMCDMTKVCAVLCGVMRCYAVLCVLCEWVMSDIWWVKSLVWISNVPRVNESCATYKWVIFRGESWYLTCHVWMIHVPPVNESCPTWIRLVTFIN